MVMSLSLATNSLLPSLVSDGLVSLKPAVSPLGRFLDALGFAELVDGRRPGNGSGCCGMSMRSTVRSRGPTLPDRGPISSGSTTLIAALARRHVRILVIAIIVFVLFVFIIFFLIIIIFGIRNDDYLSQDFVKLVSAIFLVSSPLDEDVEAQFLNCPARIGPRRLSQELVIACMRMTNMRYNSKLHSS
jgi:hypothetical protein